MPKALEIGVQYETFRHLNPTKLKPFVEAYKNACKKKDSDNWELGIYIRYAILSSFGDKVKYPDEPFSYKSSSVDNSERELSHEEIVRQTEALFGQLNIMAINYNLEHKNNAVEK